MSNFSLDLIKKDTPNTLFDIMTRSICRRIEEVETEVINVEAGETPLKDAEGKDTGLVEHYIKLTVEIPKDVEELSRLRIAVKVPKGELKFNPEWIHSCGVHVRFSDLSISFIDGRKTVYFKATDYDVIEEQFDI